MKIQNKIEWTDYLEANKLHTQPSLPGRIFLYGILGMFTLSAIYAVFQALQGRSAILGYMFPAFIVPGVYVLFRFVFLPLQIKHIYNQQKILQTPYEIELTETHLNSRNEFGQTNFPWKDYVRWKENKHILLAYHSDVMFQMFPKRAFTDEQIAFIRERLIANNVSTKPSRNALVMVAVYILIVIAIVVLLFQFRR